MKCSGRLATGILFSAMLALPVMAQTPGGGGGGRPGGGGGGTRPAFDPAAIRERIMGYIKTSLDCDDDTWKIIEPKLVHIFLLRMDIAGGDMGRNGRAGAFLRQILDPNAQPSQVSIKQDELQHLIDQKDTSIVAFRIALERLAKAKEDAKAELQKDSKELTDMLTVRQEAALVDLGILD